MDEQSAAQRRNYQAQIDQCNRQIRSLENQLQDLRVRRNRLAVGLDITSNHMQLFYRKRDSQASEIQSLVQRDFSNAITKKAGRAKQHLETSWAANTERNLKDIYSRTSDEIGYVDMQIRNLENDITGLYGRIGSLRGMMSMLR